jgi:peptidoglycan biosynthesis protein MviN/MurJ (putative lipid II flippase)
MSSTHNSVHHYFAQLLGTLMFSVMALVVTMTFKEEDSRLLYALFWALVAALSIQFILQHGEEFVAMPTLINPYASPAGKFFQIDFEKKK